MTLTDYAYLEIEGQSSTATFEFNIGLEYNSQGSKSYLMGERGQYLREVVNQTPGTGDFDASRRTGFWIDGGAGDVQEQFAFGTGNEDVQWGDGSGGDGQSNVTTTDASGADVAGISRKNVLDYWIAKSKSDSGGSTRIHFGEWSDGSVEHVTGVPSGAFGQPMPLAIREWTAGSDLNEPGVVSGQITASQVALWGGAEAPSWAQDAVGATLDAADYIPDA